MSYTLEIDLSRPMPPKHFFFLCLFVFYWLLSMLSIQQRNDMVYIVKYAMPFHLAVAYFVYGLIKIGSQLLTQGKHLTIS